MKIAGVFAHFDVDNELDPNSLKILNIMSEHCDTIYFVTTSVIDISKNVLPDCVKLIVRPNVGYDFYSYKVGILKLLLGDENFDKIFLINSSFYVIDSKRFSDAFLKAITLCDTNNAVGISSSDQFSMHLQSYFVCLNACSLSNTVFRDFLSTIRPLNSKIDVILNFEIKFSTELQRAGLNLKTIFSPDPESEKNIDSDNTSHVYCRDIAELTGIVKYEVLRENQFSVDTQFLSSMMTKKEFKKLNSRVEHLKSFYEVSTENITNLSVSNNSLPTFTPVYWRSKNGHKPKLAIVLHLYYVGLMEEIKGYMRNIVEPFDIIVTTPHAKHVVEIINEFSSIAESVVVTVVENRGRDFGPFMSVLCAGYLDDYDAVLKIHSKKSSYSDRGDEWRRRLFHSLCGTSLHTMKSTKLLRQGAGIVGPHDNYLSDPSYWGANKAVVHKMLHALKFASKKEDIKLGFFAGSMFWFNPAALAPLRKIADKFVFGDENGAQDGTLAHAYERLVSHVTEKSGYQNTSLELNGSEIRLTDTTKNQVPVLD